MADNSTAARVAGAVRAEMARSQMTRQALGELLDMSPTAVQRRLTGEIPFDVVELDQISKWLDVPITTLMGVIAA